MMMEFEKKYLDVKLANNILNNSMDYEEHNSSRYVNSVCADFSIKVPKNMADERSLNFSTSMSEDFDVPFAKKPRTIRDPMSHKIIEKRRRDRMNNCLADLSNTIPTDYLKQGRGRIEKAEIIEMAITHIKNLTNMVNKQDVSHFGALKSSLPDRYLGFKECQDEVMRCLVEVEGWDAADRLCIMLMSHLEQAGEKFRIMNDQSLSQVAKEEQYRHADEDMNQQSTGMTHALNPSCQTEFTTKEGYQTFSSCQTKPYPQNEIIPVPKQNLEDIYSIPPTYPGYEQLLTVQQITQEHLKRDSHLWTLLRSKTSQQNEDSGISVESGMITSNSKDYRKASNINNKAQYEQLSPLNSSSQESCSEKMDNSVYKFKHNITKRFTQEECKIVKSDISSSSSGEEKTNGILKRKIRHVKSQSPSSSGSSHYPISSSSNKNSSSQGSSENVHEGEKSQNNLPGFILHPDRTHYIPLTIHGSSVGSNLFNTLRSCFYHPISIPVNFGGPVLHMNNVNVRQVKNKAATQSSESMDSPSGCSSVDSVCNLSDQSPIPEQEINTPGVRC